MNIFEALTPPVVSDGLTKAAEAYRNAMGAEYVRRAATLVKTAFEVAGETKDPVYLLYKGMWLSPTSDAGQMKFASIAFQCMGRVTRRVQALDKVANPLSLPVLAFTDAGRGVSSLVGGALGEGASLAAALGVATGAVGGAGLWGMKRGLTQQNEKLRQLEIQRDTYHQLSAEVRDELARRKMQPTPSNVAAAVDYLT